MTEEDDLKRKIDQIEEEDDEVLNIIENSIGDSTANSNLVKKLKDIDNKNLTKEDGETDDEDEVMNIIDSSLNNANSNVTNDKTNDLKTDAVKESSNNDETNDDLILNIIDNSAKDVRMEISEEISHQLDKISDDQEKKNADDKEDTNQIIKSASSFEKLVPKAAIHQVETDGCLHEVVTPLDVEYKPLRDFFKLEHFKPAKEYAFTLDPFQREAILCIENNQSVLGKCFCFYI